MEYFQESPQRRNDQTHVARVSHAVRTDVGGPPWTTPGKVADAIISWLDFSIATGKPTVILRKTEIIHLLRHPFNTCVSDTRASGDYPSFPQAEIPSYLVTACHAAILIAQGGSS